MRSILAAPLAAAVSIGFGLVSPALAATSGQTAGNAGQQNAGQQTANNAQQAGATGNSGQATQCLQDVRSFRAKMQQDGYWLNGYNGMGYAFVPAAPVVAPGGAANNPHNGNGPWGNQRWNSRPGYDLRTLTMAAHILARHGNEQTCENVLNTAQNIYHRYAADLSSHGVTGAGVANWRQQQIAHARPVTQIKQNFRLQDINGTDVRNRNDKLLGNVDSVVLNPKSGRIAYLLVTYGGGAFGIGSSTTAVPWHDFQATPGLNTLVLHATEETLSKAPKVNPDQFGNGVATSQIRQQVDSYWQSHVKKQAGNKANG